MIEEEEKELNLNLFTFGIHNGKELKEVLRDRKYCEWLVKQNWFSEKYEYLYNKVKSYDPTTYFFYNEEKKSDNFIDNFKYFNMRTIEDLETCLSRTDKKCYLYYLKSMKDIKTKIKVRVANNDDNIYDIKAPHKWLQLFEKENEEDDKVNRETLKEFIIAYELPSINEIIKLIKEEGGIDYKGGKSYQIAKKRSSEQEKFWEEILKEKYKEKLGIQFKYKNCFFDFINISDNTIFECKLSLSDFNEQQFEKYLMLTNDKYNIIYLISDDCVINMDLETLYTTNISKYIIYQCQIPLLKKSSKFDDIIFDYHLVEVNEINTVI